MFAFYIGTRSQLLPYWMAQIYKASSRRYFSQASMKTQCSHHTRRQVSVKSVGIFVDLRFTNWSNLKLPLKPRYVRSHLTYWLHGVQAQNHTHMYSGPSQSRPQGYLTIVFACATLSPLVITFLSQGFTHHSHVVSFKYIYLVPLRWNMNQRFPETERKGNEQRLLMGTDFFGM